MATSNSQTSTSSELNLEVPEKLLFLYEPHRYKIAYGGRGGCKSWGFADAALIAGIQKPLFILCAREIQRSIKESVFRLLTQQIERLNLGFYYSVTGASIKGRNGTSFAFEGLWQNTQQIKSYEGVDICWVEEAANVTKSSWDTLIPTIRKDNSEIWISFNPVFEDDETYQRFVESPPTDSHVCKIGWQDNPWWNDILEQERVDAKERDPDTYDHVWEGECIQWMDGAIYAKQLREAYTENRVIDVEYDSDYQVFTAWDIGHTDDTAIIWFQVIAGEIRILECYATSQGTLDEYATQILGKETTIDLIGDKIIANIGEDVPGLEHRLDYDYNLHWLPHDARAKTLSAKGKSTIEQLATALGTEKLRIVPDLGREDGITQAKQTFKRCWFDKTGANELLRALRNYRRELQRDEKSLQKNPKHDWSSHMADAFRYLSIAWKNEPAPPPKPEKPKDITTATLDELWPVAVNIKKRI